MAALSHPLLILNDSERNPLTLTHAAVSWKSSFIMPRNLPWKPRRLRALNRNSQSIVSKAFEKSSFRKNKSYFDWSAQASVSWVSKMLSRMNLRDKKVDCSQLIISENIGCSRSCKALAKILQLRLRRVMGSQFVNTLLLPPLWSSAIILVMTLGGNFPFWMLNYTICKYSSPISCQNSL